jgi:hypothetical protein
MLLTAFRVVGDASGRIHASSIRLSSWNDLSDQNQLQAFYSLDLDFPKGAFLK